MKSGALERTAALAKPENIAAQKDLLTILKLLYSIAAHIETMSGAALERACGEYYMPKRRDPHG
jgi:hypothetical protein